MLALAGQYRPVESLYVRRFMNPLFTLAPDKNAIESNMKWRSTCRQSAFDYYKDLSEKVTTTDHIRQRTATHRSGQCSLQF